MATATPVVYSGGGYDKLPSTDTITVNGVVTTGQDAIVVGPFNTGAGQTGEIRLKELAANGEHYAGFKSADALAASIIWVLPNADGASGTFLQTNGSGVLTWAANTATSHDILSATHTDTVASAVSRGSLIYGNSTPAWAELVVGAANDVLGTNGTDVAWVTATGTGNVVRAGSPTFTTQLTTPKVITTGALGIQINANGGAGGTLRFMEGDGGANYSEIKAAVSQSADMTYTWPSAAPTANGQALECTTAGVMSWASQNLLSAGHGDTTAGTVVRGDIICGQGATATWQRLGLGATYAVLGSDGTDVAWVSSTGTGSVIRATAPTFGSYLDIPEIAAPGNPAADTGRLYVADSGGTTKLYFKDSAGTATSLVDLTSGNHAMLSATHTDSAVGAVSRGSLIYGNATPAWAELTIGAANTVLGSDGTDVAWVAATGTGNVVRATSPTITTPTITTSLSTGGYFDITEMAAPASPAANVGRLYVADAAGTTKLYFKDSAGTATSLIDLAGGNHAMLSATHTDSAASAVARGAIIIGNSTPAWAKLVVGAANDILGTDGTDVAWVTATGTGNAVRATSPTITTPTISGAVTFPDNVRQTFNPGADAAGLNVGAGASDPGIPSDGDIWYNSTSNGYKGRANGVTIDVGTFVDCITFTIDGGGSAITTGEKGWIEVPYKCTIVAATLLADQSGSIVIDIWKDTYANYAPTVADTITAAAKPTLSAAIKSQDTTLTGWTTAVAAGDILKFKVDSVATVTKVVLSLKVRRS